MRSKGNEMGLFLNREVFVWVESHVKWEEGVSVAARVEVDGGCKCVVA